MSIQIYHKPMINMKSKVDQNKATDKGISAAQLALNLNENLPEKQLQLLKKMVII